MNYFFKILQIISFNQIAKLAFLLVYLFPFTLKND